MARKVMSYQDFIEANSSEKSAQESVDNQKADGKASLNDTNSVKSAEQINKAVENTL